MADISIPNGNTGHSDNISTLDAGTELVGQPCTVWDMTVSHEGAGDAVVNISNTITSYDATYKVRKVVLTDEVKTIHLSFPKGMNCSTGLCATSNLAGVDISINYD